MNPTPSFPRLPVVSMVVGLFLGGGAIFVSTLGGQPVPATPVGTASPPAAPVVDQAIVQQYRELQPQIAEAGAALHRLEIEYVFGDGTADPAIITARRAEFLVDHETAIKNLAIQRHQLASLRAKIASDVAGRPSATNVVSQVQQARRIEDRFARGVIHAANAAVLAEAVKGGGQ